MKKLNAIRKAGGVFCFHKHDSCEKFSPTASPEVFPYVKEMKRPGRSGGGRSAAQQVPDLFFLLRDLLKFLPDLLCRAAASPPCRFCHYMSETGPFLTLSSARACAQRSQRGTRRIFCDSRGLPARFLGVSHFTIRSDKRGRVHFWKHRTNGAERWVRRTTVGAVGVTERGDSSLHRYAVFCVG
jgi:hypothetical protein